MEYAYFRHALKLNDYLCSGCTACMKICPTGAIRIRGGKAVLSDNKCVDCGECIKACPKGAIEYGPKGVNSQTQQEIQLVHVKRDLCDNCGKCGDVCYPHALYTCGKTYTIDEVLTACSANHTDASA